MQRTDCGERTISIKRLFAALDASMCEADEERRRTQAGPQTAISRHFSNYVAATTMNGLQRLQLCRRALDALDRRGWDRSFHQRIFHEEYLKSCSRIFFKRDGAGAFARSHARLLEVNGWDSTPQEILVSTPRRFGKTISVSRFAAAMMYACPNMELSIYSTCKRISQKLLRNVVKFMELIFLELRQVPYKVLRMNQEEVHIKGPEGQGDLRVINSYPSKIGTTKGTGGDIIILEEAAYVDPGFFYETVAPLLLVGVTSLIGISTLTSDINFYTRLFKIRDQVTGLPNFAQLQVTLACEQCKEDGKAGQCKHMLHLVPQWQSSARHERLRAVMIDRPDLIQSELSVIIISKPSSSSFNCFDMT